MGKESKKERRKGMRNNAELSLGAAIEDREKIPPFGELSIAIHGHSTFFLCVNCLLERNIVKNYYKGKNYLVDHVCLNIVWLFRSLQHLLRSHP